MLPGGGAGQRTFACESRQMKMTTESEGGKSSLQTPCPALMIVENKKHPSCLQMPEPEESLGRLLHGL
jgi:hypothetical protein